MTRIDLENNFENLDKNAFYELAEPWGGMRKGFKLGKFIEAIGSGYMGYDYHFTNGTIVGPPGQAIEAPRIYIKKLSWSQVKNLFKTKGIVNYLQEKTTERHSKPGGKYWQQDMRNFALDTNQNVNELFLASQTPLPENKNSLGGTKKHKSKKHKSKHSKHRKRTRKH